MDIYEIQESNEFFTQSTLAAKTLIWKHEYF